VHLFLFVDQTGVQNPPQFCSPYRALDPSPDELTRLSALGLDAPLFTKSDENSSSKDLGMTSHTEEDVHISPEYLRMTSETDPDMSSSVNFDLNLTTKEYNEIMRRRME